MREKTNDTIFKFILIFILVQPLLDLATSLSVRFINFPITLGIIVRALFLISVVLYYIFVFKSKNKKIISIYLLVVMLYLLAFFVVMIMTKPTGLMFTEVKSVFKIFYFPILLACLFDIFISNKKLIHNKYLILVAFVYLALILVPYLTGTAFPSYRASKPGYSGWFYAANETGTIIGTLFALVLFPLLAEIKKSNMVKGLVAFAIIMLAIFLSFSIGTKVPMLCVFIALAIALVSSLER